MVFYKNELSTTKSQFLEKSVQYRIFREKVPFLNCRLLRNGSFLRKVTFQMVNFVDYGKQHCTTTILMYHT